MAELAEQAADERRRDAWSDRISWEERKHGGEGEVDERLGGVHAVESGDEAVGHTTRSEEQRALLALRAQGEQFECAAMQHGGRGAGGGKSLECVLHVV